MSRTRSRTNDYSQNAVIQIQSDLGAWSDYVTIDMKQTDSEAALMVDEITPSFEMRRAKGEIMMSPCESIASTLMRQAAYGYDVRRYLTSNGSLVNQFGARCVGRVSSQFRHSRTMIPEMGATDRAAELAAFGVDSTSSTSLQQRALARVLEKATGSEALSLVTIAEMDKTVDLVVAGARSVNGMAKLLESLGSARVRELNKNLAAIARMSRKRQIKLFLRTLDTGARNIASKWLGFRYGIMASVYDLQSWIAASRSGSRRARFVAYEKEVSDIAPVLSSVANWMGDSYPSTGPMNYYTKRRRDTLVRAGVLVGLEAMSSADRFGANRIATSAWELVPFSFVIDWFLDTGTRLAASEGSLLLKPLGSWVTVEHRLHYLHSYTWVVNSGSPSGAYYTTATGADEGIVSESCLYRQRIANPTLSVIPQIDVSLNWKRIIDAIALLRVGSSRYSRAIIAKM